MYTNRNNVYYVDKTKEKNDSFFCKICSYPLTLFEDFTSEKKHKCCHDCYLKFAQARIKEWELGWRPNKKEIREYIKVKKQIHSCIINIKEN